jgi:esterase/lipase superfamily enzyme
VTIFLSFRYSAVSGATRSEPVAWISDSSFALKQIRTSDVAMLATGRDVLFAAHGFNVSQADAVCAFTRLEQALAAPITAQLIGVLWPGDSHIGPILYPGEKRTAEISGRNLARFCNKTLQEAESLSFLSHSLGARLVLEAVRHLQRPARTMCLTAAAIERDCLTEEYADAFRNTDTISVLASRNDRTLRFLFPLGNFIAHALNPSANPLSSALGFAGPPTRTGNTVPPWQIADQPPYDHGDYFPPSNPADAFPDSGAPWNHTVGFMNRAFAGQRQTWPV